MLFVSLQSGNSAHPVPKKLANPRSAGRVLFFLVTERVSIIIL
jgi:hypothetical protein